MPASSRPRRRIVYFARTALQARLVVPVWKELASRGRKQLLVAMRHDGLGRSARAVWEDAGLECRESSRVLVHLRPGDLLLVLARTSSAAWFRRLLPWARLDYVGLNEGCRFSVGTKYKGVDHFLGWGPSALGMDVRHVHIVGSTEIEKMKTRARTDARRDTVLVNYKLTKRIEQAVDQDRWLGEALSAIESVGMKPLISVHPENLERGPSETTPFVTTEPAEDLLLDCPAIVSRSSTLIHQAAAAGCQPFFFAESLVDAGEFAEPMGAYPICGPGALGGALTDWKNGAVGYDASAFLAEHVEITPGRSAAVRTADALEDILRGN